PRLRPRRAVGRLFAAQQGDGVSHAKELRPAVDGHIAQNLWAGRIECSVEQETHTDPVLAHCREVAADPPVAIENGRRLIAVSLGPRACALNERYGRERAERRVAARRPLHRTGRSPRDRECYEQRPHGSIPASSVCPYASRSCASISGDSPCGNRLTSRSSSRRSSGGGRPAVMYTRGLSCSNREPRTAA